MLILYRISTTNNLMAGSPAAEMAEKTPEPKTPNKRAKKTAKPTGKFHLFKPNIDD